MRKYNSKKLKDIWNSIEKSEEIFSYDQINKHPVGTQRYLKHAIQDKSNLATAVMLKMNGVIKLNKWSEFTAEQIIVRNKGFIWKACVSAGGINIRGYDLLFDDRAIMKWKLLNLIPVINVSNSDIYKSSIGRYAIESIWLPTILVKEVFWMQDDEKKIKAKYNAFGEPINLEINIDYTGKPNSIFMNRWSNWIDKKKFGYTPFGGNILEEKKFDGFTIPSKINAGWMFGTEQFEGQGEFFRVEIEEAKFNIV